MKKALSTENVTAFRDWIKSYVAAHSPETIVFTVNFATGDLEYTSGTDLEFETNIETGNLEYRKGK
mgnify:CR=1 FL=1